MYRVLPFAVLLTLPLLTDCSKKPSRKHFRVGTCTVVFHAPLKVEHAKRTGALLRKTRMCETIPFHVEIAPRGKRISYLEIATKVHRGKRAAQKRLAFLSRALGRRVFHRQVVAEIKTPEGRTLVRVTPDVARRTSGETMYHTIDRTFPKISPKKRMKTSKKSTP